MGVPVRILLHSIRCYSEPGHSQSLQHRALVSPVRGCGARRRGQLFVSPRTSDWPALIFSFSLTNDPFRKKIIGLLCLLVSTAITFSLYFAGLPRTTELYLRSEQIVEKVQLPIFGFFGLVGNPLAHWISYEHLPHRAWFMGLSLTIVFLLLTSIVIKRRRLPDAALWLGLGLYAYSFCLVTTYGRLGMGYTGGFLASRYTTHVTLLLIAIQALILIALHSSGDPATTLSDPRLNRVQVLAASGITCAVAALLVIGDFESFKSGGNRKAGQTAREKATPLFLLL